LDLPYFFTVLIKAWCYELKGDIKALAAWAKKVVDSANEAFF